MMDCRVCRATGDTWIKMAGDGRGGGGGGGVGGGGGFSLESEHDLAMMVSDFLENGSLGAESSYSSDSDSGFSDLPHLADKISYFKMAMDQYERDLLSVVSSLLLSIREMDLHHVSTSSCNASCIRFLLVKLLRLSGYDAGVCISKWQGSGKVPGGEYEYVDVVNYNDDGSSVQLIIDIDFKSHFKIARAVHSYDRILSSLPTIYVGSLAKLKQFLQIMVEASKLSLKQNSMPLPPWRSLDYLQAKWKSSYQRKCNLDELITTAGDSSEVLPCSGHLKRLQSSLQAEIGIERLLNPITSENRRLKLVKRQCTSFITQ